MSKETAPKSEVKNAQKNAPVAITASALAEMTGGIDDFENPSIGESFGGSYPRLELDEEQVSPLLRYTKDTKIQIENDEGQVEMRSVPVCSVLRQKPNGETEEIGHMFALPLSAIFRKHWDEAKVNVGDVLKVKRYRDAVKKRGKGAGNKLKVFALKVYSRAAQPAE